jgi:iron complex transport system substrate-binding protein
MNRWWWLLLGILGWMGAGAAILGVSRGPDQGNILLPVGVDRIVSTAPNLTEILFALGLDEKVVAVSNDSDGTRSKTGTFWQPNVEAVIAVKPDLVVTLGTRQQKELARRLQRAGYRSLILNIERVDQLLRAIGQIGAAAGRQSEASALVADISGKLEDLSSQLGTDERVRVLYVVQREPLRVAGRDTFVNELIELAGGENAIGPTVHKYPPIGIEQVIACAPEVIIQPAMGTGDIGRQQRAAQDFWREWPNLPAVANRRIYVIESDTVLRLGPRLPDGVEIIAGCLHPEAPAQKHIEALQAR